MPPCQMTWWAAPSAGGSGRSWRGQVSSCAAGVLHSLSGVGDTSQIGNISLNREWQHNGSICSGSSIFPLCIDTAAAESQCWHNHPAEAGPEHAAQCGRFVCRCRG
jgi:hypothetical protein